jgi:secreted PhoX family phosphatase
MDRPEWIAVNPNTGDVYATLTNNSKRTAEQVDDANPRAANNYGSVIRWVESDNDAAAATFEWDFFAIAGNPTVEANVGTLYAGSENINADNTFNSPDGLGFDSYGRVWIQTDGSYSNSGIYANQGNNQMLVGNPETGEIRRFLVGPKECEVTGMSFTPDSKTMFINIQHPGEGGNSHWPDGGNSLPRSATLIITKDDGGVIGS